MRTKHHFKVVLSIAVIFWIIFPVHVNCLATEAIAPNFQFFKAEAISIEEARNYYKSIRMDLECLTQQGGSASILLDGMDSNSDEPEIAELARGLKYNPDLMYQFVHNQIEYTPYWGDSKGTYMCLMDRNGNSFDQASLFIALLKQAEGHPDSPCTISNPRYVYGTMEITVAKAAEWLGVPENSDDIWYLIANAGIAIDDYYSYFVVDHIWVKVNINGTDYVFDPSFKTHTIKSGINIATAMGYNRSSLISSATSGMSGGDGYDYLKDLNVSNLNARLQSYSSNLSNYIKSNSLGASLADIIGGKIINGIDDTPVRQTSLANYLEAETWTDIPSYQKTTLRVQHEGIDVTFNASDIAGKRLILKYDGTVPNLLLDGVNQARGNSVTLGNSYDVILSINHPYAYGGGTFCDQSGPASVTAGGIYLIVNGWADVGSRIVDKHSKLLKKYRASGSADDSEEVLGESFALLGYTYLAQATQNKYLTSSISGVTIISHHLVGICGQYQGPYIDLGFSASSLDKWDGTPDVQLTYSGQRSAFEHGIIKQLQNYNAVSTVKLLNLANDEDDSRDKIFEAKSANWNSIRSQLQGYASSRLDSIYNNYISKGHTVIIPQYGQLGQDQWHGDGYLTLKYSATGASLGYKINGGYSGGYSSTPDLLSVPVVSYYSPVYDPVDLNIDLIPENTSISRDPIVMSSGNYLYNSDDLSVGSDGSDLGLKFSRHYNSGANYEKGPLGLGWTHNYNISAKLSSNGFQAMGFDCPVDAVANIVILYTSYDLLDTKISLTNIMIATLSQNWLMDQMIDNIVTVTLGDRGMQFIKLPDGSYNPPQGIAVKLEGTDGSYTLKSPNGKIISFNAENKASQISDAFGNSVSFAYTGDNLTQVTNNFNRQLNFTYNEDRINSITDNIGRSISFGYDGERLETYTDVENNVTTYEYDPLNIGKLSKIFYPTNPSKPDVTNVYSELGKVTQQTNANGDTYNYYYAYNRTEEVQPLYDGQRNVRVYYFDDYSNTIAEEDPLGRKITYDYDCHQRKIREDHPTGTATEYHYDKNHNIIEIRQIPKTNSSNPDLVTTKGYTEWTNGDKWFNRLDWQKDTSGHQTDYAYYSTTGSLKTVTQPEVDLPDGRRARPQTTYTYNSYGQIETVTDPNGMVTKYEYYTPVHTYKGALKTTIVDYGRLDFTTTIDSYDTVGNVVAQTDPLGNQTIFEYYPSRLLKKSTSPSPFNYKTQYDYYPDGKLKRVRSEMKDFNDLWQTTIYTYTLSGKIATVHGPLWSKAEDTVGSFNGYLMNGPERIAGRTGSGLEFDGSDDYVDLPDWPADQFTGGFTVSLWAFPVECMCGWRFIDFGNGSPSDNISFACRESSDDLVFEVLNGGLEAKVIATGGIELNRWQHFVATVDGLGNTVIYKGNKPVQTGITNVPNAVIRQNNYIGKSNWVQDSYYIGSMDDIVIFDRAIDANEVAKLYDNGLKGRDVLEGFEPVDYPVACWDFDGGAITRNEYDSLDRLWKTTDAEDHTTEMTYYQDDQLYQVIDAENQHSITNTYDPNTGQLLSVKDAKNNTTTYDYDDFARQHITTFADSTYERTYFDEYGRTQTIIKRAGQAIGFTYDELNRTKTKTADGDTITYKYSLNGELVKTLYNGGASEIVNHYDTAGRLDSVIYPGGKTVGYDYDDAGNRTKLAYPDSNFITYYYDQLHRLTDVNDQDGSTIVHYDYDSLSRRTRANYQNGTTATYSYDLCNRLLNIVNSDADDYSYTYDNVGNQSTMTVNGSATHSYTYDKIYQLKAVDYPAGYFASDMVFNYDAVGNRDMVTDPGATDYVANPLNQYSSVGGVAYGYDNNGNLTSNGVNGYSYDSENRIVSAAGADFSADYTYDPAGRRLSKAVSPGVQTIYYLYDGAQVIAEYDQQSKLLRKYIHGANLDEIVMMIDYTHSANLTGNATIDCEDLIVLANSWLQTYSNPWHNLVADLNDDHKVDLADYTILAGLWLKTVDEKEVYYYHYDGLGSVVGLTDDTGVLLEEYEYSVFGQVNTIIISGNGTDNQYMFTGRQYDSESSLYYYRARMYSSSIGRFLQADPIGYYDSLNLYAYVGNNPTNWVDKMGYCKDLLWYDRLAGWDNMETEATKDRVFDSIAVNGWGVVGATAITTAVDIGMGIFHTPSAIGHLGEGTGTFIANPSWETAPGMLMDVSVTASVLSASSSQLNKPYNRYVGSGSNPTYDAGGNVLNKTWLTRDTYSSMETAQNKLQLPSRPDSMQQVKVPFYKYVAGPEPIKGNPQWGGSGGGTQYRVGGFK